MTDLSLIYYFLSLSFDMGSPFFIPSSLDTFCLGLHLFSPVGERPSIRHFVFVLSQVCIRPLKSVSKPIQPA